MSDTNPLPAQELLRQADEMARIMRTHFDVGQTVWSGDSVRLAIEAYRAARVASPVTLEEALMIEEELAVRRGDTSAAVAAQYAMQEHARRLAGEGGGSGQ